MAKRNLQIVVNESGKITYIYSDELAALFRDEGVANTRRASHVEPCGDKWIADLAPVDGPILGPFDFRQQALDAEIAWLTENICNIVI